MQNGFFYLFKLTCSFTLISDHNVVVVPITYTQHICGHTVAGTWVHKLLHSLKVLLHQSIRHKGENHQIYAYQTRHLRSVGRQLTESGWLWLTWDSIGVLYLLTFSWNGHFLWSQSYKALFLKAPAIPPWLFWTEAIVIAFRTISIIPVSKTDIELNVRDNSHLISLLVIRLFLDHVI